MINILDWDSDFFGIKIARANLSRLTLETARAVVDQARTDQIACVYLLADSDDPATAHAAEAVGFHLMDIRVTLDTRVPLDLNLAADLPLPDRGSVRPFHPADLDTLKRIARASYTASRFYADPRFPRDKCDALYDTWITRSCDGWAQAVLVADVEGIAAGFITCHTKAETGSIGLVGVDANQQGKGLGSTLVDASLRWFAANGCTSVEVVTQGRNIGAQRIYQARGFKTRSVQLWYHVWLDEP